MSKHTKVIGISIHIQLCILMMRMTQKKSCICNGPSKTDLKLLNLAFMKNPVQIYLLPCSRIESSHRFLSMTNLNNLGSQMTDFSACSQKLSVTKSVLFSHDIFFRLNQKYYSTNFDNEKARKQNLQVENVAVCLASNTTLQF